MQLWDDMALRKTMQANARQVYLERYSGDLAYKQLLKIYKKIITQ